jgi:D-alanine-D-alanine ligase
MIMGNSFGYFETDNDDMRVLREADRVLHDGGVLYLDVTDGLWMKNNYTKRSWEWIDQELFVCRERHLAEDKSRLISREVVVHAEKGVIADQFYSERLYVFEELQSLLSLVGFEKITKHENWQAASPRNQDLVMMATRNIITAVASTKIKQITIKAKPQISCTVLLGDPGLPDNVKRDGKFNAEDFVTIKGLKTALSQLKGFHFSYFDDHKTLFRKFTQTPPPFVFNLCDEGWGNDPFMELHPPAVMDMLHIPYTGAGPECLALCYNKALVKALAQDMDIGVPSEIWIDPSKSSAAIPSAFPAIIKPAYGDSSVGITMGSVVNDAEELVTYYDKLRHEMPNIPILIQEFLEGREFSVGVLGNEETLEALPILEVDYSELPDSLPKILGYESKWLPDSPYWTKIRYHRASLSEAEVRCLVDNSCHLFNRLKCRDYARFDFRMNSKGEIKLLEVNPNPGWCWDGKMALMAGFGGMEYPALLEKILVAGLERYPKIGN